jgi:hypothetical protein
MRCGYELVDDIVRIMTVSDKVLSSKEHLDRGVLQFSFQGLEAVPGVVIQKPDAGVEGCAAPGFYGKKTAVINFPCKGEHILCPEAGSVE